MSIVPAPRHRWQQLDQLQAAVLNNHQRRIPLLQGYITVQIGLLLAGAAVFIWPQLKNKVQPWLVPLLWLAACAPLVYLLLPLLPGQGLIPALVWVAVLLTPAFFWYRYWQRHHPPSEIFKPFVFISLLILLAGLADATLGNYLTVRSPFGYSLIGGARYYGIGNEFMGVMVGAGAVAGSGLLPAGPILGRQRNLWLLAILATLTVALGHPRVGANFGGALAAAALLAASWASQGQPPALNRRSLVLAAGAIALTAGAVFLLNAMPGANMSHIGLAGQKLQAGDWFTLVDIARRKVAVNLKLLRWTIWNRIFLATVFLLYLLVSRPAGMYARLVKKHPFLGTTTAGAVAGSIAALLFNDSGVVAAATTLILPVSLLLTVVFVHPLGLE